MEKLGEEGRGEGGCQNTEVLSLHPSIKINKQTQSGEATAVNPWTAW